MAKYKARFSKETVGIETFEVEFEAESSDEALIKLQDGEFTKCLIVSRVYSEHSILPESVKWLKE